ncbi:glycosyltransferase family 4 protein [Mesorhizobium sp.]|uniref:glycosyltransferase family 4 protein n=1 Tax=Mesorhizobium sp. TaxID=1871066 RepID=UPI0012215AE7|nr:glycosyltransferase family 4 protein [Mesorhizobium sp.]TIN11640.1 MAG: glycosyltransferase family 4 protein [Mesorhizobium sp.]
MTTINASRVVIVGSFAPSLVNFRGSLIESLVTEGHLVVALAPDLTADVVHRLRSIGAKSIQIELSRSSLSPLRDIQTIRSLRNLFREIKPDVVIPYTIKPVVWGTLAARAAGVRRIVPMITGLGYAFTGGYRPKRLLSRMVATLLYRLALGRADLVLFQNLDDMELFRSLRLLPRHVPSAVVNGSGIDLTHFAPVPMPENPAFLMIARLLGDKGTREFGDAARMVKALYPQVPIRLVGYLDETPDSISQAELDAILASGVEFLGRLDDVRPAIAQSSVYVLPSYREGTPRSVLEAMAMGRAVITTDAPGCRETVVEGQNGYLVPPRNAQALAEAMERFMANPALAARMGAESRRIAETKYDVNLVNAEIMRHAGLQPPPQQQRHEVRR